MNFHFNFQLFAEDVNIPGIDADILKELDIPSSAEPEESKPEEEAPKSVEPETKPTAEADSDNKQVEAEDKDEYEEYKDGQAIPYDRFKSVNDRRKTAENRIKELEEKLKGYENAQRQPQQQPREQTPTPATEPVYNADQRKKICELAVQRAKAVMGLTDEDVEAMEYADDKTESIMYQQEIAKQINIVNKEIQEFANNEKVEQTMFSRNVARFDDLNKRVAAYPDAQARAKFILEDNFVTLDMEYRQILNDAFIRLQNKRGTDADYHLINSYFKKANRLWDDSHKQETPAPINTTKITQAQKLPKAPNIGGGGGGDKVYTVAELTELLNSPDGWETLPEKVKQDILNGRI